MCNKRTITRSHISRLLDAHGIRHITEIDGDLYVTGLCFNFWITVDRDCERITLRTNWQMRPSVSELDALRCANHFNSSYISLQFIARGAGERLAASQDFSFAESFCDAAFITLVCDFPQIFRSALAEPDYADLFYNPEEAVRQRVGQDL